MPPRRRPPRLGYEPCVWSVFVLLVALAVADRFSLNAWPRDAHAIGAGPAGRDFRPALKPGPWTVKVYDVVARVTGRYSILAFNLLLLTSMRAAAAALAESPRLAAVLDTAALFRANHRIHAANGVALAVLTLVHVWSILLPPVCSGWRARVVRGVFEFPLSERKPPGLSDVDAAAETVHLQVDDVFRIVEMSLLLALVLPLSLRLIASRYHIGLHVHRAVAVVFFVDIVRRHTHPHSWFLNTPVFVAWLVDHAVAARWRRHTPHVRRRLLSDDYMLLFWDAPRPPPRPVAPKYYLRLHDSPLAEPAHAFTALHNRCGLALAGRDAWSVCLIVRTFRARRVPRLARADDRSHTRRVADAVCPVPLVVWGPFHGSVSESVRRAARDAAPATLVGGGSAAAYLLDALQMCGTPHGEGKKALTVLYTCRDVALFDWVVGMVRGMCEKGIGGDARVVLAVTGGEAPAVVKRWEREWGTSAEEGVRIQAGRVNFEKELPQGETVFFQGSEALLRSVRSACRTTGSRLIAGRSTGRQRGDWAKRVSKLGKECWEGGVGMV